MKKLLLVLSSFTMSMFHALPLMAGVIVNKQTWSTENIRSLNRNAATDSADAVVYNPAGVMSMENGLYTNVSVYYSPQTYTNTVNGADYKSETAPVVPSGYFLYKTNSYAAYFGSNVVLGGGFVDYDNGNLTTLSIGSGLISSFNQVLAANSIPSTYWYTGIKNQNIEANSFGFGYTLGGAYKINDTISVSLGTRFVDASSDAKGEVTIHASNALAPYNNDSTHYIDFERDANGWGWIIGMNINASEDINIGVRYESQISLDYETTVNEDRNTVSDLVKILPSMGVANGTDMPNDLPAVLAMGLSFKATDKLRLASSISYYFQEDANWNGFEEKIDDGYEAGIAFEYAISKTFRGSMGYMYSEMGEIDAGDMSSENPQLSFDSVGLGFVWSPTQHLDINIGFCRLFYKEDGFYTETGTRVDYDKDLDFFSAGLQYKWW